MDLLDTAPPSEVEARQAQLASFTELLQVGIHTHTHTHTSSMNSYAKASLPLHHKVVRVRGFHARMCVCVSVCVCSH